MRRMICIIGTDGSGKTTLSDEVVRRLETNGYRASRVWLGAESYLMAPARRILKTIWLRKSHQLADETTVAARSTDYQSEIRRKHVLVQRYTWATYLYLVLVMTDYRLQLVIKFWRHRDRQIIVADRYLFDVAVNIGLTLGWPPQKVVGFTQRQLTRLRLPEVRIFLRVEPEISLSRKDDIPDIEYLRLRFRYYEALAIAFGFVQRDGTRPIEENADWLIGYAKAEFARPYVHYVHANNQDVGGADKVLALMAEHMRDYNRAAGNGFRVSCSLRLATPILDAYVSKGIPVMLAGFIRPQMSAGMQGLLSFALRAPFTFWYFLRLFGRERPDLIHVNDLYDFLPAAAAKLRGIPVVYHIRMIQMQPVLRRAFSWLVSRVAPASVSVSEAVRNHYFSQPVANHRAEVIHDLGNAWLASDQYDVTRPNARPNGLPVGGYLVMMVGRIEEWKGQHVFLDSVRRLPATVRDANVFALAGGGVPGKEEYLGRISAKAKALGVLMLGQRDDVPALLRAADISVHCSTSPDPFPGVVIESLLAGAATIGADAGGVREIMNSSNVGLRTPPGDAIALSKTLMTLLTKGHSPRRDFASAARARALILIDPTTIDRQMARIYQSLIPQASAILPVSTAAPGRK